jgi:hypothetical protein
MGCRPRSHRRTFAFLVPALVLLVPRAGHPDALINYSAQMTVRKGERAGDLVIKGAPFAIGQLNDNGQLAFTTDVSSDSNPGIGPGALLQYSDGKLTAIAVSGGPAPGGKTWPQKMG